MTESLTGTVALVTGASSGIGEATAEALAAAGAAVAVVARRQDKLEALAARIRAAGGTVEVVATDITDAERARAAVATTVERLGRLDTLVNNAGVMLLGPIVDAPADEWDAMIDLNLKALLTMSHAALPHLLAAAQDSPRQVADLVNISSVAGRVAREGSGVYSLTKFGVGAVSESLRQEVTQRHVRVSLVEPGAVSTELATHNRDEIKNQLAKRFGEMTRLESTDIADAVHYIVSRARHIAINELLIRPTDQVG